ncbi:MAG: helix-turn-helix domain-containing protein [Lentimicrobium sp.]
MKASYEHIDQDSFHIQLWISQPAFEFYWHYHPEPELTYIVRGNGQRFTGDRIESFSSGDLVLLGSNLPHTWATAEPGNSPDACQAVVVQFKPAMFDLHLKEFQEFENIRKLISRAKRGIKFNPEIAEMVGQRLIQLKEAGCLHWLTEFWKLLDILAGSEDFTFLTAPSYSPSLNKHNPARIDKIFNFLNQNYAGNVDLKTAAAQVHMTETSFSRFFRRNIGLTFNEYLNGLRVTSACRILNEQPEKSVAEAAWESGFSSSTHFNRIFKAKTGFSPSVYRRMHTSG